MLKLNASINLEMKFDNWIDCWIKLLNGRVQQPSKDYGLVFTFSYSLFSLLYLFFRLLSFLEKSAAFHFLKRKNPEDETSEERKKPSGLVKKPRNASSDDDEVVHHKKGKVFSFVSLFWWCDSCQCLYGRWHFVYRCSPAAVKRNKWQKICGESDNLLSLFNSSILQ